MGGDEAEAADLVAVEVDADDVLADGGAVGEAADVAGAELAADLVLDAGDDGEAATGALVADGAQGELGVAAEGFAPTMGIDLQVLMRSKNFFLIL